MCGIVGISKHRVCESLPLIERAVDDIAHRGPDAQGVYVAPSGKCVMGHCRLAILDLSAAGNQPMVSPDGNFVLAYNGECYNHLELRKQLHGDFRSSSDTETLLHWLMQHWEKGLTDLQGMFAIALWDEKRGRLLLARDRFGIKPLYFCRGKANDLIFSSELRGLLSARLVAPRIDCQALAHYLLYGFVGEPNSIVAGVQAVPPGGWIEWQPENGRLRSGSFAAATQGFASVSRGDPREMRERFKQAVASHLLSDAPIGAFLSGGVDSSAIAAAMADCGIVPRTLSVTFPDVPAACEGKQAAAWARRLGTVHTEVPVGADDVLKLLPSALAAQDQPTIDAVNTFVVAKAAKEAGLKVALSGLGGDELLGGYPVFRDVPRQQRLQRIPRSIRTAVGIALENSVPLFWRRPHKVADILRHGNSLTAHYAGRRRLFSPHQVDALLRPSIDTSRIGPPAPSADWQPADAISALDLTFYMRNQLLRDSDCMSMAHAIELRVPFLDAEFAHYVQGLGPAARQAKSMFMRECREYLPPDIDDRPKRGFTMPFATWLQTSLRARVEARLHAMRTELPCLNGDAVLTLWHNFLRHPDRVGWSRPWALFCLGEYIAANF